VLIIRAGGGVGSYAVQFARAIGAEVTGVCSTSKLDHVRSLGATHVVDYTREGITAGARTYDAIIDRRYPLSEVPSAIRASGSASPIKLAARGWR
jgi:NADPH:quinone reductase-like Zn-dependent oxidoreductase